MNHPDPPFGRCLPNRFARSLQTKHEQSTRRRPEDGPFFRDIKRYIACRGNRETVEKVARAGLSVTVRLARLSYASLSSTFVAGVLIQVFFAGMGAFGADWSYHLTFVHLLEPVPLLMVPVAFVGRLPWGLRLLPLALVFLIGVQYAFANAIVPAAALHPVNGFLILLTSLFIARRAWVAVAKRRR